MVKYGVSNDELIEVTVRKYKRKELTLKEAMKNLAKYGIDMTEEQFIDLL